MAEEYIMGSYTLFLNPETAEVVKKPLEVVFPIKWMHDFLNHPQIGSQKNLRIILDFLVTWESENIGFEVDWEEYDIDNPSMANAEHANINEKIGWINALSETIRIESGIVLTTSEVKDMLTEIVPISVLTGWDMNIGQRDRNWNPLIHLLINNPNIDEIRVQIAETDIISVMLTDAVDEDKSLRLVSLKGWGNWKEVKEGEPNWQTYEDVTNILDYATVYPMGLYTWGKETKTFHAAINRKVIK